MINRDLRSARPPPARRQARHTRAAGRTPTRLAARVHGFSHADNTPLAPQSQTRSQLHVAKSCKSRTITFLPLSRATNSCWLLTSTPQLLQRGIHSPSGHLANQKWRALPLYCSWSSDVQSVRLSRRSCMMRVESLYDSSSSVSSSAMASSKACLARVHASCCLVCTSYRKTE